MIEMTPVEAIFFAALEKKTGPERAAFLDQACGADAELRRRVDRLLSAQPELGSFLEQPAAGPNHTGPFAPLADAPASPGPEVGTRIGPYKLLQNLGVGGMGAVFLAEQEEPVKRRVALKIIKAGMDSAQVLARFEAERQALALMDHPNIAKVLDAGTIDSSLPTGGGGLGWGGGRPYFVMELVKGIPITAYCDQEHLTPKERLQLFMPVCQAIQHAHQKGIIHRDLKPSNVMIALYDGVPVPKVIDFGVAKATGQKMTERTLFTEVGQVIGTLEYMSPEQAELNNLDIDTRTDIYSLGVLLYELLTGTTPLDRKKLTSAAFMEMLRIIREDEPEKPSTRLSQSGEALPSLSAQRKTEPKKLSKMMAGDLDWIVMKALAKERNRRYETANGFAMDIQRYLADEPVLAGPPGAGYRLRKFAKKNRTALTTAAAIALLLVAGVAVSTWQAVRATRAEAAALVSERHAQAKRLAAEAAEAKETEQRKVAVAEAALANAVKAFLQKDVLQLADPATQQREGAALKYDADVRLRDVVLRAAERIEGKFPDRPLVEAEIRHTLGYTLSGMGRPDLAAKQFERAREVRREQLGPDHLDTLMSMNNLATIYEALGRHAEALKLRHETLALRKAKLGSDHSDTLRSMNNLAMSYGALGRHVEALKLREETLSLQKAKLGPDHLDTIRSMNNLAISYEALGRPAEALKLREETLALRKAKLGPDHPETLDSMNNLAVSYYTQGRHAEALKLREETLALHKAKLGADHPETLRNMNNLASSYSALGRQAEALKLREQTLALRKAKLGPDHPETLRSALVVVESLLKLDRSAEAGPIIDESLKRAEGKEIDARVTLMLRLRRFQIARDSAGCRATAAQWEKLDRSDPASLYDAARFRAVAAAVQAKEPGADAQEDADRAMVWLTKAVAAGFKDAAHMKENTDLDSLREREDFKKLIAELETKAAETPPAKP